MNKEDFIKFLDNPDSLNEQSLPIISEIVKCFPYFQPAQALYAKNLNNLNSIHYQNQLKLVAAYSANRKVLYHLLMQDKLNAAINAIETTYKESVAIENKQIQGGQKEQEHPISALEKPAEIIPNEIKINSELNVKDSENKEKVKDTDTSQDSWEKIQQDIAAFLNKYQKKEESKINETTKNQELDENQIKEVIEKSKEITNEEAIINEVDNINIKITSEDNKQEEFNSDSEKVTLDISELEKEILIEAISASLEIDMEIISSDNQLNENKATLEAEEEKSNHKEEHKEESDLNEEKNKENSAELENIEVRNSKHSFSAWMKIISNPKNINEQDQEEKSNTIQQKNQEKKEKVPEQSKMEKKEDLPQSLVKEKKDSRTAKDLIDTFIKEDPKISKPKKTDFFSPVNMARISVVEDFSFVTETLAKIYEKQGNYSKAINAYENLILKFPEKSAYFADRIKTLKILKESK